jgi:hypothetical protein
MYSDISNAISYAIHRKFLLPQRIKQWNSKKAPFVHTTAFGRKFELYSGEVIDEDIFVREFTNCASYA